MKLPSSQLTVKTLSELFEETRIRKSVVRGEKKEREKAKQEGRGISAWTGKGSKIIGL